MVDVKAGNGTSEHRWERLSTLLALVPIILPVIMEAMDKGHWSYAVLAAVLSVMTKFSSMNYTNKRSLVKASAAKAGPT